MNTKEQEINEHLFKAFGLMMELLEDKKKLDYLTLATKLRQLNDKFNKI